MIVQRVQRHLALCATALALVVSLPALAQDGNPQRQAEVAQMQSRIATLEQQVLELRLAMGELQLQLAQVQANPLGSSDDLVIGNPRLRSITIQTRGGRIVLERRGVSVSGDIITLDGKTIALDATGKIDITGTPVNVKATSDTIIKGSKVKSN